MATHTDEYRAALRKLKDWEPYLKKHSGLPGPRANLELLAAVVEEADADRLWRLSASADEYLATVGTAGLGRIALMEPETVMTWLRELARVYRSGGEADGVLLEGEVQHVRQAAISDEGRELKRIRRGDLAEDLKVLDARLPRRGKDPRHP